MPLYDGGLIDDARVGAFKLEKVALLPTTHIYSSQVLSCAVCVLCNCSENAALRPDPWIVEPYSLNAAVPLLWKGYSTEVMVVTFSFKCTTLFVLFFCCCFVLVDFKSAI